MIKYKYQRLNKEEKKEIKNEFFATERGVELKQRFNRILIYSFALILFGAILLTEAIIKKDSIAEYIYSTLLIIFGIVFIIVRYNIMRRQVNTYLVTKDNKKKTKKK